MSEQDTNYFTHLVLFWLKDTGGKDELLKGLKKLVATSEYSHFGHIGVPAGTDRPVVDNSYDYSCTLCTSFGRISGPTSVSRSSGSPTLSSLT